MTLNDVIVNGNTRYLASVHLLCDVLCSLVATCWERADFLALYYLVFSCVFSLSIRYPGSDVVLDCIDS